MAGTAKNGKPFVINGVGSAYLTTVKNGKTTSIKVGTLQDLKLSFSASDDKVYGGDGLAPIYIISKDQAVNVSATEARFSLDYLQLTNGADMTNTGTLFFEVSPTLIASGTAFTVPNGLTTIVPEQTIVTISDDVDGITNVKTLAYKASPGAGQFSITSAGVVTLGEAVTNKYITISGIYTDEVSRKATLTTASVPSFVEIRHVSHPVDMGDGKQIILHTHIFRARATGKLDIDHKRQAASAPQLEFEVMYDSSRTDDKILEITQQVIE